MMRPYVPLALLACGLPLAVLIWDGLRKPQIDETV